MKNNKVVTLNELSGLSPQPILRGRTAVIVIDAQEEYRSGRLPLEGIEDAIAAGIRTLDMARAAGISVIHVFHRGAGDGLFGTKSPFFQPIRGFEPKAGESVIYKGLPNSFAATDLDSTLKCQGVDTLVVLGFMTHVCVESTVRAALDLGYQVRVVAEATATRPLPSMLGSHDIPAAALQDASLAALFDRFAFPIALQEIEWGFGFLSRTKTMLGDISYDLCLTK